MRKYIWLLMLVIVFMPSLSEATKKVAFVNKKHIFSTRTPLGSTNTFVAGVDFSKLRYSRILRYAHVDPDEIFYIGDKKEPSDYVLASYDFKEKKEVVLEEFGGRYVTNSPTFIAYKDRNFRETRPFIIFLYAKDRAGPGATTYSAEYFIKVYKDGENSGYALLTEQSWGESEVLYYNHHKDSKYVYSIRRNRPGVELTEDTPSMITEARVLVGDVNNDAYVDIIIWKRIYLSNLKSAKGDPFVLDSESFQVMFFNAKSESFMDMKEIDLDPKRLGLGEYTWEMLPSIGTYHGFICKGDSCIE